MIHGSVNPDGTIFGGVILAQIDSAGIIEARRHGLHRFVTVAMDKVEFKAPVYVGDIVSFFAQTQRIGTSSLTVQVDVCAERRDGRSCVNVTSALVTYVAIDAHGKPISVGSTHTLPFIDEPNNGAS
ncbi:MAG: hotdog domain-containing protein [Phycisphaerae bacterium]